MAIASPFTNIYPSLVITPSHSKGKARAALRTLINIVNCPSRMIRYKLKTDEMRMKTLRKGGSGLLSFKTILVSRKNGFGTLLRRVVMLHQSNFLPLRDGVRALYCFCPLKHVVFWRNIGLTPLCDAA